MQQFIYNGSGQKLVQFLLQNIPLVSFAKVQKLLRTKDIKVNDIRVTANVTLQHGDRVVVYGIKPADITLVYDDANIVVVDKPAGIEVETEDGVCLRQLLCKQLGQELYSVHRLDRNTSGLCMFAKNLQIKKQLDDNIKHHNITKSYWAIVVGVPSPKDGQINVYLKKDAQESFVKISDTKLPGYDKAITNYKLCKTDDILSLLDITLVTGKTHQIRASFAHIGYPILGDQKYGNKLTNKQYKATRQYLMAHYIKLDGFSGNFGYLNGKQFSLTADRLTCGLNLG